MEDRFIINTITDWSEPPRARHQVTMELSKKHKVVFVNASKTGFPGIRKEILNDNLSIIYPSFPVHFKIRYRLPFINEIYQIWLFNKLIKEYPQYQMINFDFSASLVHHYFKGIYYCNDNFTKISKRDNNYLIYKYHKKCEEKVAKNAIFCVATSGNIKDELNVLNANVYEIPLGGPRIKDYGINIPLINKKANERKIRIGLVGFIKKSNTSPEILNALLETNKVIVDIIGPVESLFLDKLVKRENVNLLGTLVNKELYSALNKVDVGIVPYHFSKVEATPNKLLVYLALGKPAVATHLKSIDKERYEKDFVYFVENKEDFVDSVMLAYENNTKELMLKRIEYAEKNSWEQRIENFLSILNHFKNMRN